MGFKFTNYGGTALYRYEQTYPRIDVGEQRVKCAYCGQWGEERSQCKHCGGPIDEARTIVNHNFEGSLYGYPLSECIEVTSMSSAHKEFLLPNGNVVKVPRDIEIGWE